MKEFQEKLFLFVRNKNRALNSLRKKKAEDKVLELSLTFKNTAYCILEKIYALNDLNNESLEDAYFIQNYMDNEFDSNFLN